MAWQGVVVGVGKRPQAEGSFEVGLEAVRMVTMDAVKVLWEGVGDDAAVLAVVMAAVVHKVLQALCSQAVAGIETLQAGLHVLSACFVTFCHV